MRRLVGVHVTQLLILYPIPVSVIIHSCLGEGFPKASLMRDSTSPFVLRSLVDALLLFPVDGEAAVSMAPLSTE